MSEPAKECEGDRRVASDAAEKDRAVEEESPQMRSVALMSPLAGPSLLPPPPSLLSRPSAFLTAPTKAASFGVKKEWSGKTSTAVWNVKSDDLDLVPVDYPLERTHREICEDACTVAKRISCALQALSIEAEYVSEEAKAKCKTNDCVGFRIRLYAGSETGEPVVVEIQRRCGSSSSFMRSCRAILDAAEGKELKFGAATAAVQSRKLPPFMMKKPIGQLKCLQSIAPAKLPPPPPTGGNLSLDNVIAMLRSKKRESNIMGLENLCCLTDEVKTAPSAAVSVSKTIIVGDDKYDVREDIRSLTEGDGFDEEDDIVFSRHMKNVRHLALTIFANALSVCCKDGCLVNAVEQQPWFVDYLIPLLLEELKCAETNTGNAYHAAWCLQSLIAASAVARQALTVNGGIAVLEEAHSVGLRRHELLFTETKRCLESLGSTTTIVS